MWGVTNQKKLRTHFLEGERYRLSICRSWSHIWQCRCNVCTERCILASTHADVPVGLERLHCVVPVCLPSLRDLHAEVLFETFNVCSVKALFVRNTVLCFVGSSVVVFFFFHSYKGLQSLVTQPWSWIGWNGHLVLALFLSHQISFYSGAAVAQW